MKDEFDEERSLWNQIKSDARHIDQLMVSILLRTQPRNSIHVSKQVCQRIEGMERFGWFQNTACNRKIQWMAIRETPRELTPGERGIWKQIQTAARKIDKRLGSDG
jgi:hypothetical protein